jgi:heme/copper-type cytochrome/quinol oxidase subunit 2
LLLLPLNLRVVVVAVVVVVVVVVVVFVVDVVRGQKKSLEKERNGEENLESLFFFTGVPTRAKDYYALAIVKSCTRVLIDRVFR